MSALRQPGSLREASGPLVLDAAMGTELEVRGARMDDDAWCALVNLTDPQLVRAVHEDHIRAGADIVTTNTFLSGIGPMTRAGFADRFEEGNRNALRAAREAIDASAHRPVALAGSVGATPWGAPAQMDSSSAPDASQLRDGYARQVELLVEGGVDVIALEMVTDMRLGPPAVQAALDSGLPVWLGLSMQSGHSGGEYESMPTIDADARAIVDACLRTELDAVNVMHTDIADVDLALQMLGPLWDGPVGVYPHHGRWSRPHWTFVDVPTDELVSLAGAWIDGGVVMVGGCCGLRGHHVAALRRLVDNRSPA
jgi:S-methylmethionine-dependent homocysteine/selenocysteine methylase